MKQVHFGLLSRILPCQNGLFLNSPNFKVGPECELHGKYYKEASV